MKLLIVDDEKLTRDGLLHSIDWEKIGIDSVFQADDGINGLNLAKQNKPEIILSDVRMPRMNGIEMANRIREILPDSSIIFMSGFSDKEYLKAAIRLKAISYVEKPILPSEVEEVVNEAVLRVKSAVTAQHSHDLYIRNNSHRLALELIYSKHTGSISYADKFKKINVSINASTSFTTLILKSITPLSDIQPEHLNRFYAEAEQYIKSQNMDCIYTDKQDTYVIYHVFSSDKPTEKKLSQLAKTIADFLLSYSKLFIAIGKTVTGADKIFDSYNSAVILLQNSFFYDYNSVLQYEDEASTSNPNLDSMVDQFKEHLSNKDMDSTISLADELYQVLKRNRNILVSVVKNTYYRLLTSIMETSTLLHLNLTLMTENFDTILDDISKCSTLSDLHGMFIDKISLFYSSLQNESTTENATIYMIKEYIAKNYKNEQLSVKDISEHAFLSFSYVCTVFKSETGKTLNQYITEFRIEKAKSLLLDPRYKITEIASKVGYGDSNYFGKLFKKMVGLSPSEFREKNSI